MHVLQTLPSADVPTALFQTLESGTKFKGNIIGSNTLMNVSAWLKKWPGLPDSCSMLGCIASLL